MVSPVSNPPILNPKDHPWMGSPDVSTIFAAFPPESLRFVGGCVRDALWGSEGGDIDLATTLEPNAMIAALKAAKIRAVPTGLAYGTVTALISGQPYEITSLRQDVQTDGRRARVAYTTDWAEDAQRRDLTVNALYASPNGQLYDPTGQGLTDIKARKLRFVGEAALRVQEDYLRILRYFRFLAWYGGKQTVDAESLRACREHRAGLKQLSVERIWSEIKALLAAPDPERALRIMLTNEVLESLLPEASNVEGAAALIRLEAREGISPDPLLRLMALSARDPLQILRLATRLKMSKVETARLRGWAEDEAQLSPDMDERAAKAAIYKSGGQVIADRAILRAAGTEDAVLSARWTALSGLATNWEPPAFPVSGKDLSAAGVPKGKKMGKTLKALEALWIRSGFVTEKPQLLAALKLMGF